MGKEDGLAVGCKDGMDVGCADGSLDGPEVGCDDGWFDGEEAAWMDETMVVMLATQMTIPEGRWR